jgi:hypothetical protein
MAIDPDDPATWYPIGDGKPSSAPSKSAPAGDDPRTWFPVGKDAGGPPATTQVVSPSVWSRLAGGTTDAANYAAGITHGITRGLSFGLADPLDRATAWLFPGSGFAQIQAEREKQQQQFQQEHPLATAGAEIAGSLPTYVIGEGALRAAVPVATRTGLLTTGADLGGAAVRNALVSGAQAGGMADGSIEDRLRAAGKGAAVGAVAGPAGEVVGGLLSPITRGIGGTSGSVTAADAALGDLARTKYNIPVTAADLSSNQFGRTAADQAAKLPFSGAAAADAAKLTAWRKAIVKEMGEDAEGFTPKVMSDTATRTGQVFDDVAQRTTVSAKEVDNMTNKLATIDSQVDALPVSDADKKALRWNIDNIMSTAAKGNGTISGANYQALTRSKSVLDRLENAADPNTSHVGSEIRDALDEAFDRSASAADQDALKTARYQWRIMKTVEPLAAASRGGEITPDAFMQKVLTASRRFDPGTSGMAYTGGGAIGELARIGKLFRASPQTATADRLTVNALTLGAPGGAAYMLSNPAYLGAIPAALLANRLGNAALRSNWLARNAIASGMGQVSPYAPSILPGAVSGWNALQPP